MEQNTNYEISPRTVVMASAPGITKGGNSDGLRELVDVYPTLCELAGLPQPSHLQGTSFVPLMRKPDRPWKKAAFCIWTGSQSMRTDRYRLTRYNKTIPQKTRRQFPSKGNCELFDHHTDTDENVNVAGQPEYKEVLTRLIEQMDAGYEAARPRG